MFVRKNNLDYFLVIFLSPKMMFYENSNFGNVPDFGKKKTTLLSGNNEKKGIMTDEYLMGLW